MTDDAHQALAKAQACLESGDLDAGLVFATRAATEATDPATRARAGSLQAVLTFRRGDYAVLLALAEGLAPMLRAQRNDDARELQRMVALASAELGRLDLALSAAYELHALAEATGQPGPLAQALNTLGCCFERMGDPWQAERQLLDALALARASGSLREMYAALNNLGAVLIGTYHVQRGSEATATSLAPLERALPLAEETVDLQSATGDPFMRVVSEGNLGEILVHLGERDRSRALLDQTLADATRMGFRAQAQRITCSLAEWALRQARPEQARSLLATMLSEAGAEPLMPMTELRTEHALYLANKALGEAAVALRHLERHSDLLRERTVRQLQAQSEQFVTRVEAEYSRREAERQRALARSLEADTRCDPLTGLGNRRALSHHLPTLLSEAAAAERPVTLAMLDLDHFKRINDRYGHALGDRVLVAAAQLLRDCVREADLVTRIGGEEFMAVLPETEHRQALHVCERIRHRVAGHNWASLAPGLTVTLSAGLACTPPYDEETLSIRADKALYRAKELGRDRVEIG